MEKDSGIYLAGHTGLVGSALMRKKNFIHHSYLNKVKKFLFLGSSCIYPKQSSQPLKEKYLLTDILEYTNEPYAIAKIAGIKLCESFNIQYNTNYISVMPTNLYGPGDNYNLEKSHVLPALMRKIHLGKCLEEGNWTAIRKDLSKHPVEKADAGSGDEAILEVLKKYGIQVNDNVSGNMSGPSSIADRQPVRDVTVTVWGTGTP